MIFYYLGRSFVKRMSVCKYNSHAYGGFVLFINVFKRNNIVTYYFRNIAFGYRNPSFDYYNLVFFNIFADSFKNLRKNNSLNRTGHILKPYESHNIICFCIFYVSLGNETSGGYFLSILYVTQTFFYIAFEKIRTMHVYFTLYCFFVFGKRMSADIYSKHLLFKRKLFFCLKLLDRSEIIARCNASVVVCTYIEKIKLAFDIIFS